MKMSTGNIDQMNEDMDELFTCDENPFFASLMTSDIEGSAQRGEEVCCSQAVEQSEHEFSACSSVRDLHTTAGCTGEFDISMISEANSEDISVEVGAGIDHSRCSGSQMAAQSAVQVVGDNTVVEDFIQAQECAN